jgi:hypothetical protein
MSTVNTVSPIESTTARGALRGFAQRALEREAQARELALHQEIIRARLQHGHRGFFAGRARHADERQVGIGFFHDPQRLQTRQAGQSEVRHHQIPGAMCELLVQPALAVHDSMIYQPLASLELAHERVRVRCGVLDHQNRDCAHGFLLIEPRPRRHRLHVRSHVVVSSDAISTSKEWPFKRNRVGRRMGRYGECSGTTRPHTSGLRRLTRSCVFPDQRRARRSA